MHCCRYLYSRARENNADFVCSTVQVSLLVGLKMISVKGPLTDQDAAVAA